MAKLTLATLNNLQNENTAVAIVNSNSTNITVAMENTLSRDGSSPNYMAADLDINSHKILNIPDPVDPSDIVRLTDLQNLPTPTEPNNPVRLVDLEEAVFNPATVPDINTVKYIAQTTTSGQKAQARTNIDAAILSGTNTFPEAQTFTVAPVFTDPSGSRTALGLGTSSTVNTGTSGTTIPLLNGTNTWANAQTFTAAPVFTDASGSRTALGLGTAAVKNTGTSGNTVPLLDGSNTWSNAQTFTAAPVFSALAGTQVAIDMPAAMRGYIDGLTLAYNNTTSFQILNGVCVDSTNARIIKQTGNYTKSTSSWAVGSGNGGLDTGSIAANKWYHVYAILRSDTGVVDYLFSESASAPTMPTNYDYKRRIGSISTDGSSQFMSFVQYGDEFYWSTPIQTINVTDPGTSAVTRTLSVPTGVKVCCICAVLANVSSASSYAPGSVYLSSLDLADVVPSTSCASIASYVNSAVGLEDGSVVRVWSNTSGQIRSRLQVSGAGTSLIIITLGWVDLRGKNA